MAHGYDGILYTCVVHCIQSEKEYRILCHMHRWPTAAVVHISLMRDGIPTPGSRGILARKIPSCIFSDEGGDTCTEFPYSYNFNSPLVTLIEYIVLDIEEENTRILFMS